MVMNPLTEIFGSRTKIRIIGTLARIPGGMTRNAVRLELETSTTRVYEQMEQLKALGVLREDGGLYALDDRFPFHDLIAEAAVALDGYFDDPGTLLARVDDLFSDGYFLTGFAAATARLTPIDYEMQSLRIGLLRPTGRQMTALDTLDRASVYDVSGFPVDRVPDDVERTDLYNTPVWCAGLERSVLDCLTSKECSTYGAYLVFCHYVLEGGPDVERLAAVARETGAVDLAGTLLWQISGTDLGVPFGKAAFSQKDLDSALNTIRGG
jgi:hypothetical protein